MKYFTLNNIELYKSPDSSRGPISVTIFILALMWLLVIGCGSSPDSQTASTAAIDGVGDATEVQSDAPVVDSTRIAARVAGVLVEEDGCLRLQDELQQDSLSRAIVWQKDLFDITRVGDEIRIVNRYAGNYENPTVWRIGERIQASGGTSNGPGDLGTTEFNQDCEGPYEFVSGASTNSQATEPVGETLTREQTIQKDTEGYAARNGVTFGEAETQLSRSTAISQLQRTLRASEKIRLEACTWIATRATDS